MAPRYGKTAKKRYRRYNKRFGRGRTQAGRQYGLPGRKHNVVTLSRFNGGTGVPQMLRAKLAYCSLLTFTTSTWEDQLYSGNSLFDPQTSIGGHQPLYFDEMMLLYRRYYVRASKIECDVVSVNAGTGTGTSAICICADDSSQNYNVTYPNISYIRETTNSKFMAVGVANSGNPRRMKQYRTTKNMIPGITYEAGSGGATVSPDRQWYWHVIASSFDEQTEVEVRVQMKITYYVEFYDVQTPDPS